MLFTICQFSIPTTLQIYYNIFPLFIVTPIQLLFGIYYHTNFILSNGKPYIIIKIVDQIISVTSSVLIITYGINSPITLIIASGVPIFYIIELLAINKYKIKNKIIGAAGLHSLVHISAISASSFIVFYIKNDYNIFDTILILSAFLFGILLFFIVSPIQN
tara:strand:- start:565 stop:1047 length:483 start_codon:yes stop_codon:yes gene_type:complete